MISQNMQRFTFTALVDIAVVFLICVGASAAQQTPPPPDTGGVVSTAAQDPLTKLIAERMRSRWNAFKKSDAVTYGAFLTEDFRSIDMFGLLHGYKPTPQEFASFPVADYIVSQVLAVPIGQDGALVTFTLTITPLNQSPLKLTMGEVWVKQAGLWKCEYSQSTATI